MSANRRHNVCVLNSSLILALAVNAFCSPQAPRTKDLSPYLINLLCSAPTSILIWPAEPDSSALGQKPPPSDSGEDGLRPMSVSDALAGWQSGWQVLCFVCLGIALVACLRYRVCRDDISNRAVAQAIRRKVARHAKRKAQYNDVHPYHSADAGHEWHSQREPHHQHRPQFQCVQLTSSVAQLTLLGLWLQLHLLPPSCSNGEATWCLVCLAAVMLLTREQRGVRVV